MTMMKKTLITIIITNIKAYIYLSIYLGNIKLVILTFIAGPGEIL